MTVLSPRPLDARAFSPFGHVIAAKGAPDMLINQGKCGRFHDLSRPVTDSAGVISISLFVARTITLPTTLEMVERHPLGSQSFLPMTDDPFLVIVAPDRGGTPGRPVVFLTDGTQGVTYAPGTWHGVLTALSGPGRFAVVDRVGPGDNLQEHWFSTPYTIAAP